MIAHVRRLRQRPSESVQISDQRITARQLHVLDPSRATDSWQWTNLRIAVGWRSLPGYSLTGGSDRCSTASVAAAAAQAAGGCDDRFDHACERAILSRSLFRPDAKRHQRPHRVRRRRHHLPHDGLHRVRQSGHSRQCRHGQGRGLRRDLPGGRDLDPDHGVLCQLPDRARARHGTQRLLRLHAGAGLQIHLAAGARIRVPVRRAGADHYRDPAARIHHQRHPAQPEARGFGRRRAVPRHHRAAAGRHRRRSPGRRWSPSAI